MKSTYRYRYGYGTIRVRGYVDFLKFRIQYDQDTLTKILYENLYICKILEENKH